MNMNRRNFTRTLGATALAGMVPGLAFAQTPATILLGQSVPLTGALADYGFQYNAGAQLYFDAVNAKGGIGGKKIEVILADDGYVPAKAVENTKKFIAGNVVSLFGYLGTPAGLAVLPVFTEAKVPFIAPYTGVMGLRDPFNKYAFHVRSSYDSEVGHVVRHIRKFGKESRVAAMYQNDPYGASGMNALNYFLNEVGEKLLASGAYTTQTIEVEAAVKACLDAKPEVIVMIATSKAGAEFIRQAKAGGFKGSFYNISGVAATAFSENLGAAGEGVYVSQVMPSPYTEERLIAREFSAAIREGGNKVDRNYLSIEGYIAARVFVEGLRRVSGPITRESVILGMERIGRMSLSGYPIHFSSEKHVASTFTQISRLTKSSKMITTVI